MTVEPSGRTAGGFRLYTQHDVERLLLIRGMKPLGFTLEEVGELLRHLDAVEETADPESGRRLDAFIQDARERREKLARALETADEFIQGLQLHTSAE